MILENGENKMTQNYQTTENLVGRHFWPIFEDINIGNFHQISFFYKIKF